MLNLLPAVMTDLVYPVHKALNCIYFNQDCWVVGVVIDVMVSVSFSFQTLNYKPLGAFLWTKLYPKRKSFRTPSFWLWTEWLAAGCLGDHRNVLRSYPPCSQTAKTLSTDLSQSVDLRQIVFRIHVLNASIYKLAKIEDNGDTIVVSSWDAIKS